MDCLEANASSNIKDEVEMSRGKRLGLAIGCFSNLVAGMMYVFPVYTKWLVEELSVSDSSIVLLGNLCHAAFPLVFLPLALIHSNTASKRKGDMLVTGIAGCLQTIGPLLICTASCTSLRGTALLAELALGWVCMGAGSAGVIGHTMWVMGHNYAHDPASRRMALAAMPLALGCGPLFATALYKVTPLRAWDILFLQAILSALSCVSRFLFLHRVVEAQVARREESPEIQPSLLTQLRSCLSAYCTDALSLLVFLYVTLAIGMATSFLSMIGNVLQAAFPISDAGLDNSVSWATVGFLAASLAGRVLVLLVQRIGDVSPWLLFVAAHFNTFAFAAMWALDNTFTVVMASSLMCGLCFGVTWGAWSIVIATHSPGGVARLQLNMSITMWAIFAGNLAFAAAVPAFLGNGMQGRSCYFEDLRYHGKDCYMPIFGGFTIISAISILISLAKLMLIRCRHERAERR